MKRFISLLLSVVLLLGVVTATAMPVSAASDFSISEECVALLKEMEGFDKYPRWDYSQWTVGHGTRCPDADLERYRANGITEAEADVLLRTHAASFAKSVNSFIDKYGLELTQNQFDALLLFTYNFGSTWMFREGSFRSGLINGVTGNDFMYEIGQWCHAGGSILRNLISRRLIEANMYFNGVYSRSVPENYCYVIFEFNGGEGETDVQAYDSNLPAEIRVTPTREGYTFAGWFTANKGGKKITELDASTRNITLYARWVEGENAEFEENPPEEEPDYTIDPVTVSVKGIQVNVRTGPGTNYTAVTQVSTGETLTITEVQSGTGYTWGKFAENRWIALMYTNYETVVNQQPSTEPAEPETEPTEPESEPTEPSTEPTEPPVEEEPEDTSVMGTVTGSDLRIRSGAGTGYSVVGWLQIGDRITVTERKWVGSMEWGKMETGWVSLTYVKLDEKTEEPEETVPETKPTEPETQPTEPETQPTEPETEPVEPEQTVGQTGTVKVNDFLRIRNGAGLNNSVVGYYGPNASVTILETKTVSGMVWGRTDKGWISMDYVVLDQSTDEPSEQPNTTPTEQPTAKPDVITGTVNVNDFLRIRSGAGLGYSIVGYLEPNDRVTITETKRVDGMTWGKISSGWISMDYVITD